MGIMNPQQGIENQTFWFNGLMFFHWATESSVVGMA